MSRHLARREWPALGRWVMQRTRVFLALGVATIIVVHGLWPSTFKLDSYELALIGVLLVLAIAPLLRSASVPGGGNRAAHGELITPDEAHEVFGWADTLNRSFGVGYSLNFAPNLDFESQGLVCEYEHCIENMPLHGQTSDDTCPMWGHDCPGGRRRVATCPAAEAWRARLARIPEQPAPEP